MSSSTRAIGFSEPGAPMRMRYMFGLLVILVNFSGKRWCWQRVSSLPRSAHLDLIQIDLGGGPPEKPIVVVLAYPCEQGRKSGLPEASASAEFSQRPVGTVHQSLGTEYFQRGLDGIAQIPCRPTPGNEA